MSLNKQLTSYHEAGHAVRAYYLRKKSLVTALISLEEIGGGHWNGSTGVNLDPDTGGITLPRHVDIALAGLMAEARFNGLEPAAVGEEATLPDAQDALPTTLHGYFDLENTNENQQVLEQTPVCVASTGGALMQVVAAVSFADLDMIPIGDRNVQALSRAITRLSTFFNDEEHWFRVRLLAENLENKNWPMHFDYIAFLQATMLQA